jgi:hypothetical protein
MAGLITGTGTGNGIETAITDIEIATCTETGISGTENAAAGTNVSPGSMNASTCAAILTFAELSCAVECSLAFNTTRLLVPVRVDGSAADQRADTSPPRGGLFHARET